jgi:hypothetical protein
LGRHIHCSRTFGFALVDRDTIGHGSAAKPAEPSKHTALVQPQRHFATKKLAPGKMFCDKLRNGCGSPSWPEIVERLAQ